MLKIRPEEIESVEEIGSLNGEPVSLLKTVGGFHIAASKSKGVLAQGSHPAIVKYNLAKQNKGFAPMLTKSESSDPQVVGMSDLLPAGFYQKGFDLYSLQKSESSEIDYVLTKAGSQLVVLSGQNGNDEIQINDVSGQNAETISKYLPAMASAISEDTSSQGKKLVVNVK